MCFQRNVPYLVRIMLKREKRHVCQICHNSVYLNEFSNTLFIFLRPAFVRTKVHFKTLGLLVITLGTGYNAMLNYERSALVICSRKLFQKSEPTCHIAFPGQSGINQF